MNDIRFKTTTTSPSLLVVLFFMNYRHCSKSKNAYYMTPQNIRLVVANS